MLDNQFTLTTIKQELENYNMYHGQSDKVDDLVTDIILPLVDILIDQDKQIKQHEEELTLKTKVIMDMFTLLSIVITKLN